MLKFARALGASFALVLLGFLAAQAVPTTLPLPTIPGPFLGDSFNNLYTVSSNYLAGRGHGAINLGSISQTSGQANCTTIAGINDSKLFQATTSASTGYICLPTAYAGVEVIIANATGQTVDIYSNATSYTVGTADKINGTAGTSAYTGLTSGKTAICVSPVNGLWYCGSIS